MRLVRACLEGVDVKGNEVRVDDPEDLGEVAGEAVEHASEAARLIERELTTGELTHTRSHLVASLVKLGDRFLRAHARLEYQGECEVVVSLCLTDECRAELEAFNPDNGVSVREEVSLVKPPGAIRGPVG